MRVLIVVAGIVVYLNSFQGVFLFDDDLAITNNPYVRSLWPLGDAMTAPPQSPVAGRPLASLSLAVNYALGGLNPWGYHAFNLTVHVLAGLTLFGVLRRTLSLPRVGLDSEAVARRLSGIAALIWTVHPLQTESVTYIVQRAESMAGLFFLLTMYCAIRSFVGGRRGWQLAAVLACAAGMATKEVMATCPLVVLLYDRVFAAACWRELAARRRGFYAALAATWLILAWLIAAGPRSETVGFSLPYLTPWEYARSQFPVIMHYLRLCFWPHSLCLDYAWPVARHAGEIVPPMLAVAGLLFATGWALVRRPSVGFLGSWFFVILAPTSSIVPIRDLAFEHRMYLPLAGVVTLAVLLAWKVLSEACTRKRLRPLARDVCCTALALAAIVPLGYATISRNRSYHSVEAMWRDVLATRPGNPRARCGLAYYLAAHDRLGEALEHYRIALRIEPGDALAHNNVGGVLAKMGRLDEAVEEFAAAVRLNRDLVIAQVSLGNALRLKGDLPGAISAHRRAIEIAPTHGDAYYNLGLDLDAVGRHDEAADAYLKALRLDPSHLGAKKAVEAATSRPASG